MWRFLDYIPYPMLIFLALFMLVAPIRPMPHLVEKLIMLKNGALKRPIDILDLLYHIFPTILLFIKFYRSMR